MFVFFIGMSLYAGTQERLYWPQEPDPARIEYIDSFSTAAQAGVKKGFFSKLSDFVFGEDNFKLLAPFGLKIVKNKIYVTDISLKSVYVFDTENDEIIDIKGSSKQPFLYPIGVCVDDEGNIYVSDSVRAQIFVFKEDGDFKHIIQNVRIKRPVGVAINPENKNLYIVDAVSSQIHVMNTNGKFLFSIGNFGKKAGEFNRPTYIAIGKNGKLYVTDSLNHRVQILDKDGNYISSFGNVGEKIGSFVNPRGIAVDSDENIYVSDTLFNAIQIFNQKGELLLVLGRYGNRAGEFSLPVNISISENDKIYISDTNNKRVQMFKRLNISK
ncbi:hypothetical protein HUE87_11275 [Candidatus Sulfurimonas marisnigri]|uniref:6-bladed beta-propeller n=1 Tax=Candidatus Sulfurimonas marisnigri TaxID=2740405 RepID=A0A7S7LZS7_9BACT|nr:6-bladed beta-propeller [Candidatus Sulfurimonas marisnigri]QOY54442.1 hypothetical protein HUE87_11275 [Candidatus Sulfurimonas marisnigri]